MSRFKHTFQVILISTIAIFIGIIIGILFQRSIFRSDYNNTIQNDKLKYTMQMIESKYVDNISRDSLSELIIADLLSSLDPHSEYIPARDVSVVNEALAGKFDGIGVMFNMFTDTALITNVINGGPSSKAGVTAGDKIITVNDSLVAGKKLPSDTVVGMLRGTKGTNVKLGIQRGKNDKLIYITVTRGEIPMRSVAAAFMIKPEIGYVRVDKFAATTYKEFMGALSKLQSQGMKKLIIDLRDNGGGFLEPSILMANEFLPSGAGIVYTEGANSPRVERTAQGNGQYKDLPLVVMMSPESASASEIFAGAMQDNDRATIIGLRSFGKGLIQEQLEYPDGSAARITIAHYYTPLGRSIQKPYLKGHKADYQQELWNRYRTTSSELLNADSIAHDSSQRVVTPKGHVLYGGGGIHPDIFVPIDTSKVPTYFRRLIDANLIFKFATKFTEDNRSAINEIRSFADFDRLASSDGLFTSFVMWADRQGVKPKSEEELQTSKRYIIAQLKAYIGRNTALEDNALYYYFYPIDKTMSRAVDFCEYGK